MERRVADGIDGFLDEMRKMDRVGGVEITLHFSTQMEQLVMEEFARLAVIVNTGSTAVTNVNTTAVKTEETTINRLFPTPLVDREGGDIVRTQGTNLL